MYMNRNQCPGSIDFITFIRRQEFSAPGILARSKKLNLHDEKNENKSNTSFLPEDVLNFSPSVFLNSSVSTSIFADNENTKACSSFIVTSTPAKYLEESKLSFTPLTRNKHRGVNSENTQNCMQKSKQAFLSTTPRTPTPLRVVSKEEKAFLNTPTIDEISELLLQKQPTDVIKTPENDFPSVSTRESCVEENKNVKESLRRTLFETPSQSSIMRTCGVNLFSDKEINAIEQMSTCFTPRKEHIIKSIPVSAPTVQEGQQHIFRTLNYQTQPNYIPSEQQKINILPLVGKPLKIPLKRLPAKHLQCSHSISNQSQLLQFTDAFKMIAYGQSNDQKFLTEQARIIMKKINGV